MLVKDMYLKKNKLIKLFIICFVIICNKTLANEDNYRKSINEYLLNLDSFTSNFIQESDSGVEEGKLLVGEQRIRVEYNNPTKILIIMDKDRSMYYNFDIDEIEFFNTQNTSGRFFFELFKDVNFFSSMKIQIIEGGITLEKETEFEDDVYKIKILFENNPLVLRKIIVTNSTEQLMVSLFNHNHNAFFNKNTFKLINPNFFN